MLADIALFLAAAVLFVPLFKRLGLGAVLGYLAAGAALGPWGLRLISDVESILHFSEFGVVLLLFIIGLELQPSRLWRLRTPVFGLGGAQVVVTWVLLAGIAMASGLGTAAALVAGFGLAMSSTAFVLQMLGERKELTTHHGRAAFSILLFQDLSVIPFLALIPMLGGQGMEGVSQGQTAGWIGFAKAVGAVVVVVIGGRYALRPLLRRLAALQVDEVFTAAALLVVTGTALAMDAVGLSMSLGAFLAGVLLADSEYRHELQADIEPFKGLLLGLFFIAVGMSANIGTVLQRPGTVTLLVLGLVLIKAAVLYGTGRLSGLQPPSARALAVSLSQGGEFAFVLFGVASAAAIITPELEQLLIVVVTLSMIATPPLYNLQARWRRVMQEAPYDLIDVQPTEVIIAGFGPFGQIIGRILRVKKIGFTILDKNADHVSFLRQFGNAVFYSDAARLEVLKAAHAGRARLFVIAIADPVESLRVAETVSRYFPNLQVIACARTRQHALQLMDLGVGQVIRRSYYSSLEATRRVLRALGDDEQQAQAAVEAFRRHDEQTLLKQQAVSRDEQLLIQTDVEAAQELEQLFEEDRKQRG